jgi:hypothetical protein
MNPYGPSGPSGPYGPGGMGPYGPGYDPSMEGMYPEDMGMDMMPQGPVEGTSGQPGVDFPAGEFHPSEWINSDAIDVWAHDDTVAPGKTYRYRARYKIKNPLYMIQNIAKDPKDSNVFALVSDWSEWSEQVSVPRLTNFFVVSRPLQGRDTVRFDVFRWQDGIQQKESFDVGPGDAIGREMAGVDFGTGWRLVDVRPDAKGSDTVAILVNDDGEIERRSFQSDQKDALYQKLKTEADAAKAITASANAR